MQIAPSLSEANIWFIFRNNGLEVKVLYRDGEITVLKGYLWEKCKKLFIKTVENYKL